MTHEEMEEVASYVAHNFVSPLCFSEKSAKEIYLEMSGKHFSEFCSFLHNMVKE